LENTGPTASQSAWHFANIIARSNVLMADTGVQSDDYDTSFTVSSESTQDLLGGATEYLWNAGASITSVAFAWDGPGGRTGNYVAGTQIDQFKSVQAAIAYDRAIFTNYCNESRPLFAVPAIPGAFGVDCMCDMGLEVSMVIGDYRVAVGDDSPTRSPAQVTSWAEQVAQSATVSVPGL